MFRAAAIVVSLLVPTGAADGGGSRGDVPVLAEGRVLLVGDSTMAALRWYSSSQVSLRGFDWTLDVESCRRLSLPSCRGREGRTPPSVTKVIARRGRGISTVVVMAGYHSETRALAGEVRDVLDAARRAAITRVVILTLHESSRYPELSAFNRELRQTLAARPDVVLADWDRYASGPLTRRWFTPDGIHLRISGAVALGDFLSRLLASLDGRACPMPRQPGGTVQDPCPRPDQGPPLAEPRKLYAVPYTEIHCYQWGSQRVRRCMRDMRL